MSRQSCIEHPAQDPFVMLRRDYMALCDNDACAAMLLHVFEHWTNTKLRQLEEGGRGELWVYRSRQQLRDEDLCGAFGLESIDNALERLLAVELLRRRRNPTHGWDRKWQYLLDVVAVQRAIDRLNMHSREFEHGSSEIRESNLGNPTSNTTDSVADSPQDSNEQPSSRGNVGNTGALEVTP